MAKQKSLFPYSGQLRDLIGYERNGEHFLRRRPEIVRQTAATRRAAQRFGVASRKAAMIRKAFYHELDIRCDNGHINRLNKLMINAAGNNTAITGFRFNQHAGTDRFFTVAPRLFRNEVLHIPPQILARYKGITMLEVKVIAARIDFNTHQVIGTETAMLMIDPRESFEGANISLNVRGEGTLVVALQVCGMYKNGPSCNRKYLAADIIAVAVPQMPECFKPGYPQGTTSALETVPDAGPAIVQRE
ncbi:hypothetical protein [Chitinophaga ginsengisoli]|uniref:Uncharacterized protein n=1 Tax=Chitinophaga ginsengisoli TaxID=363837 RepID=A0A2P8FRV4_9BACT|nr:hypothetical protein [Chitinophaga ginsengisoli]PSL24433.1 hypothetical protein CLV42_11520 [Chitinophaga ginsengisoli]